jgi:hypothetical protein
MIEEPVQKLSDSSMNLNSLVDQRISSSEKRDRCIIKIEEAERNSKAKSRSETESRELRVMPLNPNCSLTYYGNGEG